MINLLFFVSSVVKMLMFLFASLRFSLQFFFVFTEETFTIKPDQLKNGYAYNFTLTVTSLNTKMQSKHPAHQVIKVVTEISNVLRIEYKDTFSH